MLSPFGGAKLMAIEELASAEDHPLLRWPHSADDAAGAGDGAGDPKGKAFTNISQATLLRPFPSAWQHQTPWTRTADHGIAVLVQLLFCGIVMEGVVGRKRPCSRTIARFFATTERLVRPEGRK
jgi:hypothetical protein